MLSWPRIRLVVLAILALLAPLAALPARPHAAAAAPTRAQPAAIVVEPDFAPCPAGAAQLATMAATLRRDKAPRQQQISVNLAAPAVVTVLGYVKEGHPESCPGGPDCGQGQLHEEIKVLVGDELIGEHRDRGDVDEWFVAGPWRSSAQPAGAARITVAHRLEGTTAESVSYKLTVCAQAPPPADDAVPVITTFTLNEGAATTTAREVRVALEAVDPAPSSGWGLVRFDELANPGGPALTEGAWRPYAGGPLNTTLTLGGPLGVRPVRAVVCDAAGHCAEAETAITLEAGDGVPPCVTSLTLDGGAAQTVGSTIAIRVGAEDPAPGGGVAAVRFAEYFYSEGAWLPTAASRKAAWQPYDPAATYTWRLSDEPGVKYIQAWARDAAGNISTPACARQEAINRVGCAALPLGDDRTAVFRYDLPADTHMRLTLTSTTGDADLYIYPPDYDSGRPAWESKQPAPALDQIDFVAPVTGAYQVEVYRFSTTASYCLEVFIDAPAPAPGAPLGAAPLSKPDLPGPTVDPGLKPALAWPLPARAGNEVYLPSVGR